MTARTIRQENHRSWGNSIEWSTPPHEVRTGLLRRRKVVGKLVGWLNRRPEVGDKFVSPMQSGKDAIFTVTSVEGVRDSRDMFFADVEFEGYEQ